MIQCITEEIIWDLSEKEIFLDMDDLTTLELYLQKQKEIGSENMRTVRKAIFNLFEYVKTTSIKQINRKMVVSYFQYLNTRLCKNKSIPLSHFTKLTHRAILFAFFRFYRELNEENDPNYVIPIPSGKVFEFRKVMDTPKEVEDSINEFKYTTEQLLYILNEVYKRVQASNYSVTRIYFPSIVLMMFTGMRVSECLTIRKENLHLDQNYLITGLEENARKNNKPLYFAIPNEVVVILKEFLNETDPKNPWLFSGSKTRNDEKKYMGKGSYDHFLRRMSIEIGLKVETHSFRKTLITNLIHESKTPPQIVETLTNHSITSLIFKTYDQYSVELRKKDYFEYLPKSYNQILEYLRNL